MADNKKYVIVTGASGFVGSHLVPRLLKDGYSVIAITRSLQLVTQKSESHIVWCEWSNIESLLMDIEKPTAVIHLATAYGRESKDYTDVENANVLKPLKLLELAIKFKIDTFINTDSYFSKSELNYPYMRPYIITKCAFRQWGEHVSKSGIIRFINMRLEHVYGPGDRNEKFIPFIVNSIRENKESIQCTNCLQRRDFIYVDDVVSAYMVVLANQKHPSYCEYQVGLGYSVELKKIVEYILKQFANSKMVIDFGGLPQRENEIIDSKANVGGLIGLGWKPVFDYKKGVQELIRRL